MISSQSSHTNKCLLAEERGGRNRQQKAQKFDMEALVKKLQENAEKKEVEREKKEAEREKKELERLREEAERQEIERIIEEQMEKKHFEACDYDQLRVYSRAVDIAYCSNVFTMPDPPNNLFMGYIEHKPGSFRSINDQTYVLQKNGKYAVPAIVKTKRKLYYCKHPGDDEKGLERKYLIVDNGSIVMMKS